MATKIKINGLQYPSTDGLLGQAIITDGEGSLTFGAGGGGGGGGSVGTATISEDPPAEPSNGALWWNSETGTLKIYYNDDDSSQWIDATSIGKGVGATVQDTTTSAIFYPMIANSITGNLSQAFVNSEYLTYNPNAGLLTTKIINILSDATLKENAEVITDPFAVLNKISGMSFNWKDTKQKSYGIMAQVVEQVLPELVNSTAKGKKTVDYLPLIAFLIEAVKMQQQDIEELKKQSK